MTYVSRKEKIEFLFPDIKSYRLKQIEEALFQSNVKSWDDVSTLPAAMRDTLKMEVPFNSLSLVKIFESKNQDTFKAVVEVEGGEQIETVLMRNRRDHWSICVSSQVGCAMKCGFCATGKMGLTRNLGADEIIDQYRLWQDFLTDRLELDQQITNIVYMGMGEPMANYMNVKESINKILKHTDIGQTRITVSTVGVLPRLDMLLNDPEWPHVRLAVSLHSADKQTRMDIVPTSYEDFLPKLDDWTRCYLKRFGNRRHHLTFEYVLLNGVNDTPRHAKLLAVFVNRIGKIRVNLIPFNFNACGYTSSTPEAIEEFVAILEKNGVTSTVRRNMGEDIDAACGQLVKTNQAIAEA